MAKNQTPSDRVAAVIRGELARRGIRGTVLGEWLGLGPGAVSRRLNGWTPFSVDELGEVAGRLGVNPLDVGVAIIGPPGDEKIPGVQGTSPEAGDHWLPTTGTDQRIAP